MTAGNDLAGRSIGDLLDRAVERFGDREALVFDDERLTFRDLAAEVDRFARGLLAVGVEPSHHVAIWMPNSLEWVYTYLAVARIGAVLVPVNTGLTVEEAAYVIGQSDSSILVVGGQAREGSFLDQAREVMKDAQVSVQRLVVVGEDPPSGATAFTEIMERAAEVPAQALRERREQVDADDVVLMLYTSGTTGFPKGAMHSHKVIRNMADAAERMALVPDDTVVLYLPLFHVFAAFAGILGFMYAGGRVILAPSFDPARSLRLMQDESATVVYGIGTHYYDQIMHPDFGSYDLSSVRLCLTPGTADFTRFVEDRMGPSFNLYGMTETTSITTFSFQDDDLETRAETVGYPLPGFELRVVDPMTMEELAANETGELVVRGHPVMLGYYKKPEATAQAMDRDGWFRTGDAVQRTEEGYLRFAGRIKDMFKVGGENVDPIEVEVVLARHPAVGQAIVVGVPDDRMGETGAAYVQLVPGESVTKEELLAHVRENLARFKVPNYLYFVEEFPKTGSGKIQKFRLREEFLNSKDPSAARSAAG